MWQSSFNPSSGRINVNSLGIRIRSGKSSAAPVADRSRTVHGYLSPPYSILAAFITRTRGAIRVSTIAKTSGRHHDETVSKYCAAERLNILECPDQTAET